MGKGLSPLQHNVLAVLDGWAPLDKPWGDDETISNWARPRDIIDALNLRNTPAVRAAISKSLTRLWERGLVVRARAVVWSPGKSFGYRRWTGKPEERPGQDYEPFSFSEIR